MAPLSDDLLAARLKGLAARQREATAQLVAHLAELETRGLHWKGGYPSLFAYCRRALLLSEHQAFDHAEAARVARRLPAVVPMLAEGALTLTTLRLLAPHLTAENRDAILELARGKSKRQVEELVAVLAPQAEAPSDLARLRADAGLAAGPRPQPPGSLTTALAPDRYKLQVTIDGETLQKLRLARDLLSHAVPWDRDGQILGRALRALLAELAKSKFAASARPRESRAPAAESRHVPAAVKREVWVRDAGACAFVAEDGRRCGERRFLEFHHRKPFAVGGEATAANIELRCRSHNAYEAGVYFARGEGGEGGLVQEPAFVYG